MSVSFALMFAVQLLISSLCITAPAEAVETLPTNHCHESMDSGMQHAMPADSKTMHHSPDSTCSHCAAPEDFSVFTNSVDHQPAMQLIAIIAMGAAISARDSSLVYGIENNQAPPDDLTTLYLTTQRIRI